MKLLFVFLCLSLATLSLAAIPSAEEEHSLSSKKLLKPFGKKVKENGSTPRATSKSQATKKPVESGKKVLKKRQKKVGATKGVRKTSAGAGKKSSAVTDSGKSSQGDSTVLGLFPKVLVELIGGYLEGYSVVFTRNWSAARSLDKVAVDSERHYLITEQDVQASSHSGGVQVSLRSLGLSRYENFHSSHDGRSAFFTGKSQEQVSSSSSERTARWLVQETATKSLKSVAVEGGESSFVDYYFILSANGKTLLSTRSSGLLKTSYTTFVYQIKEHGKAALASKKGDFNGYACAVSGKGNRVLVMCKEKRQLEIHDISEGGSNPVLKINCAGADLIMPCALNNDGSKAAFIDNKRKLYIVDVDNQKGSISISQLTPIDIPSSSPSSELIYDAKGRLYAFGDGNLWLVDPSKRELVSLEKAQVPQGYKIQSSTISPNGDYIALLIRSNEANEKGYQYQMVVKRNEEVTKDALMRLCGHKS